MFTLFSVIYDESSFPPIFIVQQIAVCTKLISPAQLHFGLVGLINGRKAITGGN